MREKYVKEDKAPPPMQIHKIEERPTKHAGRKLEDIIFTEANAKWVHYTYADAFVITARMVNNNVHRLMVDDGSTLDISSNWMLISECGWKRML